MGWILVIVGSISGVQMTTLSLDHCRALFQYYSVPDMQDAYCINTSGDRVYLVRDGKVLIP